MFSSLPLHLSYKFHPWKRYRLKLLGQFSLTANSVTVARVDAPCYHQDVATVSMLFSCGTSWEISRCCCLNAHENFCRLDTARWLRLLSCSWHLHVAVITHLWWWHPLHACWPPMRISLMTGSQNAIVQSHLCLDPNGQNHVWRPGFSPYSTATVDAMISPDGMMRGMHGLGEQES